MSVMEVSHRGKAFSEVAAAAEADLRELMAIRATTRYCSCRRRLGPVRHRAMNLATRDSITEYVNTGHWSNKAIIEARRYCKVHVAPTPGAVPAGAAAE